MHKPFTSTDLVSASSVKSELGGLVSPTLKTHYAVQPNENATGHGHPFTISQPWGKVQFQDMPILITYSPTRLDLGRIIQAELVWGCSV